MAAMSATREREAANRIGVEQATHVVALGGSLPLERREIEERVRRPARQEREDVAQVRPRLDGAELRAREQRGEGRVHGAAVVAADEEPVLATDGFAPKRELARVV